MSPISRLVLILATLLALGACTDPERYPVSGEECGPEDPVKDIDASMADCAPNI